MAEHHEADPSPPESKHDPVERIGVRLREAFDGAVRAHREALANEVPSSSRHLFSAGSTEDSLNDLTSWLFIHDSSLVRPIVAELARSEEEETRTVAADRCGTLWELDAEGNRDLIVQLMTDDSEAVREEAGRVINEMYVGGRIPMEYAARLPFAEIQYGPDGGDPQRFSMRTD
jgi:hypothetical protein